MAWVFNITILGDYMFYIVFDIHALWLIKINYKERERERAMNYFQSKLQLYTTFCLYVSMIIY